MCRLSREPWGDRVCQVLVLLTCISRCDIYDRTDELAKWIIRRHRATHYTRLLCLASRYLDRLRELLNRFFSHTHPLPHLHSWQTAIRNVATNCDRGDPKDCRRFLDGKEFHSYLQVLHQST